MKPVYTSVSAAVMALFLSSPAYAADVYHQGGSTKDSPGAFDAPQNVNWTGFYVGGRAGYGHANHDLTLEEYRNGYPEVPAVVCGEGSAQDCVESDAVAAIPGESRQLFNLNGLDSSGFTGGGQVGFDVQRGRFIGGVFGSYDFSNARTTVSSDAFEIPEFSVIEQGDSWSIGARAGLLVNPRTLVYVLAAYTQTEFTFAGIGTEGADKDVTFNGVTAGAGVEFALTNNIFMGIEGTHTFYGNETLADSCTESCGEPGTGGLRLNDEIGETKVMGTLKFKLNSDIGSWAN